MNVLSKCEMMYYNNHYNSGRGHRCKMCDTELTIKNKSLPNCCRDLWRDIVSDLTPGSKECNGTFVNTVMHNMCYFNEAQTKRQTLPN